jgi:hypothetical protein
MLNRPEFPLKVVFQETGEEWLLENESDAAQNLEWFDSEDPEEAAVVTDKQGRPVRLKIEGLKVIAIALKTGMDNSKP